MEKEEVEKEIEKKKQLISDYMRIAPLIGIDLKEQERQIDLMLEDLAQLLKQKKVKQKVSPTKGMPF